MSTKSQLYSFLQVGWEKSKGVEELCTIHEKNAKRLLFLISYFNSFILLQASLLKKQEKTMQD